MERKQFTFYRSFYEALSMIEAKADRADAFDAICQFALYGRPPDMDKMSESGRIAFTLIRPVLEAGARKAEGGRRGGKATRETESQPTALTADAQKAVVFSAYMDKIKATPSREVIDGLSSYISQMGADCCLRAIDIAVSAHKTTWSYVQAILRDKLAQGVHSISEWDELDRRRQKPQEQGRKSFSELVGRDNNDGSGSS